MFGIVYNHYGEVILLCVFSCISRFLLLFLAGEKNCKICNITRKRKEIFLLKTPYKKKKFKLLIPMRFNDFWSSCGIFFSICFITEIISLTFVDKYPRE